MFMIWIRMASLTIKNLLLFFTGIAVPFPNNTHLNKGQRSLSQLINLSNVSLRSCFLLAYKKRIKVWIFLNGIYRFQEASELLSDRLYDMGINGILGLAAAFRVTMRMRIKIWYFIYIFFFLEIEKYCLLIICTPISLESW